MPADQPYKHYAISLCASLLMLAGCSKVPDWAKPETLYGKVFSEAEERLGDELKSETKSLPVFGFFKDKESDDLDHVYDELSGDLENRNHQESTLMGGGSVELPEETFETSSAAEKSQELDKENAPSPKKDAPNNAFPGLSGKF